MNQTKARFFEFFIFKYPQTQLEPPPTPHWSPLPQLINMSHKVQGPMNSSNLIGQKV
jgi:hypothetical protein